MAFHCRGARVVCDPESVSRLNTVHELEVGTVVDAQINPGGGKDGTASKGKRGVVIVQWDSGAQSRHRCGDDGECDLRVLDTAPAAVHHDDVTCATCQDSDIWGIVWQCRVCTDVILCNACYQDGKHDIPHPFLVHPFTLDEGVEVPSRDSAAQVRPIGIFADARVVPLSTSLSAGIDDDQAEDIGTVLEIYSPMNDTALVECDSGGTKEYLIGQRGKVEVRFTSPSLGNYYFQDHLPILKIKFPAQEDAKAEVEGAYSKGSLVQLLPMDQDILQTLQEQVEAWSGQLPPVTYEVGEVKGSSHDTCAVEVFYRHRNASYVLHSAALSIVHQFQTGDVVTFIGDRQLLIDSMESVGTGWTKELEKHRDSCGKIVSCYENQNVTVQFDDEEFIVHPGCLKIFNETLHPREKGARNEAAAVHKTTEYLKTQRKAIAKSTSTSAESGYSTGPQSDVAKETLEPDQKEGYLQKVNVDLDLAKRRALRASPSERDSTPVSCLAKALFMENIPEVRRLVKEHSRSVLNSTVHGTSLMHIAVHCNSGEMVKILFESGCQMGHHDKDSNTPLHLAVLENRPAMVRQLLCLGAATDSTGVLQATPLHMACETRSSEVVRDLIQFGASLDQSNAKGDSPLHDAVRGDWPEVVELLLQAGASVENLAEGGFNAAQLATYLGYKKCLPPILMRAAWLANNPKYSKSSFTLLHLACVSNYSDVAAVVLSVPSCDLEARDHIGATPLRCSIARGCRECVELLVSYGADLHGEDEDGNTPLHVAIFRLRSSELGTLEDKLIRSEQDPSDGAPLIADLQKDMPYTLETSQRMAAIACFLVGEGASLTYNNHKGQSPLDFCLDDAMREFLVKFMSWDGARIHESRTVGNPPLESYLTLPEQQSSSPQSSLTSQLSSAVLCRVRQCYNQASVTFLPCKHEVTCRGCSSQFNICPICRAIVETRTCEGIEIPDVQFTPVVASNVPSPVPKRRRPPTVKLACNFSVPRSSVPPQQMNDLSTKKRVAK